MKEGGEKTVFWVARCAASFSFPSGSVLSHIISHDFHLQKKNLNDGKTHSLAFSFISKGFTKYTVSVFIFSFPRARPRRRRPLAPRFDDFQYLGLDPASILESCQPCALVVLFCFEVERERKRKVSEFFFSPVLPLSLPIFLSLSLKKKTHREPVARALDLDNHRFSKEIDGTFLHLQPPQDQIGHAPFPRDPLCEQLQHGG